MKGSKEDDDSQPPHRQAANHHRRVTSSLNGQFTVTMEQHAEIHGAALDQPLRTPLFDGSKCRIFVLRAVILVAAWVRSGRS
jgi:hypothetical protein